jgi:hypothetical protein
MSESVETGFEARAGKRGRPTSGELDASAPLGFAPLFLLVFAINLAVVVLARLLVVG